MRLIAEKLGGERGGQPVFSDIDFSIDSGECLMVTGPNGSGKSTLLRVIAGLLPRSDGEIRLEGGGEEFPSVASASHYLGHLNGMKPAMTVGENLGFWQDFGGAPGIEVGEALEAVGLETVGHLPFGYLSTGQRRRISIARLLVNQRPIWILDEPSAGLDRESERRAVGADVGASRDGGLIVAATHLSLGIEGAATLTMNEADEGVTEREAG